MKFLGAYQTPKGDLALQEPPLSEAETWILAVLSLPPLPEEPPAIVLSRFQINAILFVASRRHSVAGVFEWTPDAYGPVIQGFSRFVRTLKQGGRIRVFTAAQPFPPSPVYAAVVRANLPTGGAELAQRIVEIRKWIGGLSFIETVREVYTEFPEVRAASILRPTDSPAEKELPDSPSEKELPK